MSKKKKDPYEEAKEQGTTLESFVIYQRISAFTTAYQPCEEERATNIFNEAKLRDLFKAWPCSLGDPLGIYLEQLETSGFKLTISSSGEMVIFTTEKMVGSKILALTNEQL